MKRTYFKERIFVPLVLLMVLAAIVLSFISCMPEIPGEEDTVVIPPAPDPLPGEEEPEQPKAWVWHLTGSCPESLSFQIPEDESGVQIFINERGSKVLSDGDEYTILSERVKAKAVKGDGLWTVYLDGSQCGVLKYE